MITIYTIPCDDPGKTDHERLEKSLGEIEAMVVRLDHRRLDEVREEDNPWWGFLFSNEWFDKSLAEAIPIFLQHQFDYLVLHKKSFFNGKTRVFSAPRLFRAHVQLEEGHSLVPKEPELLKFERVLDGWLRD